MVKTEVLQPLSCDSSESQKHANNLKNIKSFLTDLNTCDDSLTMTQFLQLINLSYEDYVLATRSTIRSDILFLKRAPDKLRVNNYNVHCLKAWRANIDIQFVLDVYACAAYITFYVAKSSRGMSELLQTACEEAKQGQRNFKQQLRHIGNKFVFHFLLLFSFQPPFQASPFLYTVCARARFHPQVVFLPQICRLPILLPVKR
jgi:hypothetical protein